MALTKVDAQLLNGAVTADSSGNVGIGTSPNGNKLAVGGKVNVADGVNGSVIVENISASNSIQSGNATFTTWKQLALGSNGLLFNSNGGNEAARLDTSGNLLVGTTATSGNISNNAVVAGGAFHTTNGSFVPPSNGTWNTISTLTNAGLYIVHAYIPGYNAGTSDWSNGWFVTFTGGNNAFISPSVFGATGNITCRISAPSTIQIFASAGAGITYAWSILRVA